MNTFNIPEKQDLTVRSLTIVKKITDENPEYAKLFTNADSFEDAVVRLKKKLLHELEGNEIALRSLKSEHAENVLNIGWKEAGIIRLLNYINYEGSSFSDPNRENEVFINHPIKHLFNAIVLGKGYCTKDFFLDMLFLFRQINGKLKQKLPSEYKLKSWMSKYPSGLSEKVLEKRKKNKERILKIIIKRISSGEEVSRKYFFDEGITEEQKYKKALQWWNDYRFHLRFAVRNPDLLNEMLDFSLRQTRMKVLRDAYERGIPFFVNPYYLSLIDVTITPGKIGTDRTLRDYIFHSRELVEEFGNIVAWEKEDIVEPGKPNAAGWILPGHNNIHRRYPEVAIFIPDTRGRACGGLCVSCQRMYDFQSGHLNFNLDKLEPKISWDKKMKKLLEYWEKDTQLREILVTGGDAFMNTTIQMQKILDGVYNMAERKIESNKKRPDGEKYAELVRVRIGTRLPAYLPQRITKEFVAVLADFKERAKKIGIKQFIIQIHVESPMEVTPLVKEAVSKLLSAGWVVTNQLVFTAAASRRGHTIKLRKVLNDIGVITYYTFSVKGFNENYQNFATNERSVQEKTEEKIIGKLTPEMSDELAKIHDDIDDIQKYISEIRKQNNIPFIATDRNVLNMPGVGKSMRFNTIGITSDGRRVLQYDHDHKRVHSPIVNKMDKVVIVESKSISEYLKQMESMGEDINDYMSIWGYSSSDTEGRVPVYRYPEYDFKVTDKLTNYED